MCGKKQGLERRRGECQRVKKTTLTLRRHLLLGVGTVGCGLGGVATHDLLGRHLDDLNRPPQLLAPVGSNVVELLGKEAGAEVAAEEAAGAARAGIIHSIPICQGLSVPSPKTTVNRDAHDGPQKNGNTARH